ncbi:hypothetical protein Dda_1351 [Drechslerella dactyloides]|uniref:3-keto-steroid reductase n=1 Tax=Drechslerella dactyloides TaxID=74499 RepID=A0AAD6NLD5_DREDA|nr:hypothetical protein Dda_1351 [Drechslerella dactyloides]
MDSRRPPIVAVITGANSGLGYAIACRLIVEFFTPQPAPTTDPKSLVVCLTTRSREKAETALANLAAFASSKLPESARRRLELQYITLDLASLISVTAAAVELRKRYARIHYVFCNAAVIPFVRLDWFKAARQFATGLVDAMTQPRYQVQGVGWLTDAHAALPGLQSGPADREDTQPAVSPDLGMAFTANVFGHYYLIHEMIPTLLARRGQDDEVSRVIWIGSIESKPSAFDIKDIQGIKSTTAYESSKTLTDILVLGSHLPQTETQYRAYASSKDEQRTADAAAGETIPPVFLVAHPGVVSTTIVALPWWQTQGKILGFWLCKALGSPWHCIDPYIGANAPVWLALSPHIKLLKGRKWGSASSWKESEIVIETKVDVDIARYAEKVWSEMERLRSFWKYRLDHRT